MAADKVGLLGSDSTVLGEVASAGLGGRAGVALSRGRFAKQDVWVDPNEDAVFAAHDGDRWLLVAIDGHFGFDAAEATMELMDASAPSTLADDRDGRVVVASIIESASMRVAEALSVTSKARSRSRTAVSVVLVRAGEVFTTTCGDSSVFLVRGSSAKALTPATRFLGPNTPSPPVVRARLRPGDGVAAVTDGFTDYLGRAVEATLCRELTGESPERAARALVVGAFAGGAGDNVGVSVLLPAAQAGRSWVG